ncbi:hypothetical protein [Candidatus Cardinium hertigii]|jgi:hypothetical protein|uniref:RING-type domain-containing protein n=1 Tax=Candidatus Cardinium hertigii TaxID=247481 RepID=A0A3N2QDG5_9BACT|nr:hypothetical protein [Candidatus Cardinium hertigii]ROT47814.1 hypothetical protein EDM02_00355 [Candidatus Cardinium hertigii]
MIKKHWVLVGLGPFVLCNKCPLDKKTLESYDYSYNRKIIEPYDYNYKHHNYNYNFNHNYNVKWDLPKWHLDPVEKVTCQSSDKEGHIRYLKESKESWEKHWENIQVNREKDCKEYAVTGREYPQAWEKYRSMEQQAWETYHKQYTEASQLYQQEMLKKVGLKTFFEEDKIKSKSFYGKIEKASNNYWEEVKKAINSYGEEAKKAINSYWEEVEKGNNSYLKEVEPKIEVSQQAEAKQVYKEVKGTGECSICLEVLNEKECIAKDKYPFKCGHRLRTCKSCLEEQLKIDGISAKCCECRADHKLWVTPT